MIKVTRKGVDVKSSYEDDFGSDRHSSSCFCKDINSAKKLTTTIRQAVKLGYGFAKCRAIMEGDTL